MLNAAILSLLLLCIVIHHCDCLPRQDNDAKIKAKVESLLHLLAKTKSDEQSPKEDKRTDQPIPVSFGIRPAIFRSGGDACSSQPVVFTANSGTIQSPGYADSTYPNNARCQWRITAPSGKTVSVTFQELSLERHSRCAYDSVTLYDGSSTNSPQLAKVCTVAPGTITSSGSSMFVVFESDYSVNNGRFSLSWTFQGGQASCGSPPIEPWVSLTRIVNGEEARQHSWPWQCYLLFDHRPTINWQGYCGGTVISDRHILTAAHCFFHEDTRGTTWKAPDSGITVKCGLHNRQYDSVREIRGVTSVMHENYNQASFLDSDIAILQLPTALTFNDYIQPVCLPSSPVATGTNCVITGWGDTQNTGSNNVLRQAVVPTLSYRACRAKWGNAMSSNKLCASTAGGKGICFGDSGGPLVCKQGDKWLQYGINSFVYKHDCVEPNYPTVYANVVSLLPWIQQKTGIGPSARTESRDGSKQPVPPFEVENELLKKRGSKPPDDLYGAEKELLDLLQRKFADD